MKIPFRRRDPAEALKAVQQALADAEGKIHGLIKDRAAKLIESDGVDEVAAIDRQIEAQQQAAGIHRDRITALKAEVRRLEIEAREREHGLRIAETVKALAKRDAIAAELETSIRDMGRLYFELIDQNLSITRQWGMSLNAIRIGALGDVVVRREVSWALFAAGRPRGGITRMPGPSNVGLGITGDTSGGSFAERIAGASRDLLAMIRAVPTRLPEQDEAA